MLTKVHVSDKVLIHTHIQAISRNNLDLVSMPKNNIIENEKEVRLYQSGIV